MYDYQKSNRFFAQISVGMEDLGVSELRQLNALAIQKAFGGLHFGADPATLYRINYTARLLTRVLAPLKSFSCHSSRYLSKKAGEIQWSDFLSADQTFAVFATVSNSKLRHSQYAALCLKDAVVDWFRDHWGRRPSVKRPEPDVWINLHVENNRATISLDTSGGSLHRRGYRQKSVEAPMQETLAAAVIRLSEWDGNDPLYDPMCGSGTLLGEALMSHCRIPSGYLRKRFGFEHLPDFDRRLWASVREEANHAVRALPAGLIGGSDRAEDAVQTAGANLKRLPGGHRVDLQTLDFRDIRDLRNRLIVCNPPYGIRLGDKNSLTAFYKSFGDFLKQRCKGSTAFVYFGDRRFIPAIGLRPSWKKPLKNAGLDGRLAKFEMY